ncbi:hypothetical protein BPY_01530 [Bifidobacterium psychraerophilum]
MAVAKSSLASRNRIVFSGIFTSEAASIGNTRTRWESSASEGNTVAGSPANVINVKSVTPVPL